MGGMLFWLARKNFDKLTSVNLMEKKILKCQTIYVHASGDEKCFRVRVARSRLLIGEISPETRRKCCRNAQTVKFRLGTEHIYNYHLTW